MIDLSRITHIDGQRINPDESPAETLAEQIALACKEVAEAAQELEAWRARENEAVKERGKAETRFERAARVLRPLMQSLHNPPEARP